MTGWAVSARGLVHIYRMHGQDVVALTSVDLEIAAGEMVALLGPSGAGKSTLLRLLAGVQRPSAGRLRVGGHDLVAADDAEVDRLRAGGVGVMVQGAVNNLLAFASPHDNVALAQVPAARAGIDGLDDPRVVLDRVGLADVADRPVGRLTPGQQQRLAVAVSVAARPAVLLVDEPTSRLDHRYRDEVLATLHGINADSGTTVVAVTHDPDVAAAFGRTVTIRDGRIGAEGRGGEEFAVVGRDGSVQLPPRVRDRIPPGSLLRVADRLDDDGVVSLQPIDVVTEAGEEL
jgi:putative ABC transport system ATP-binding protein